MLNKFGKLRQDYKIAIKEANRAKLEKCEFHDECESCKNPSLGSFAYMDTYWNEVSYYICGSCLLKTRSKEYRDWVKEGLEGLKYL